MQKHYYATILIYIQKVKFNLRKNVFNFRLTCNSVYSWLIFSLKYVTFVNQSFVKLAKPENNIFILILNTNQNYAKLLELLRGNKVVRLLRDPGSVIYKTSFILKCPTIFLNSRET